MMKAKSSPTGSIELDEGPRNSHDLEIPLHELEAQDIIYLVSKGDIGIPRIRYLDNYIRRVKESYKRADL